MCNHDCLNCKYKDCIDDNITLSEINQSVVVDKKLVSDHEIACGKLKPKTEWNRKNPEKVKMSRERFNAKLTPKMKLKQKEYQKRYREEHKKEIAEYREKNRELILAKRRAKYWENPEKERARVRENYARKKAERAVG